jgi:Bardet-Biedl syndrome 2 protein
LYSLASVEIKFIFFIIANVQIPDGANAVVIGEIGSINKPLAIVGGNCALQGFDYEGNDCYWTVTGDNITSMALSDIDEDGQNEVSLRIIDFVHYNFKLLFND